MFDHIFSPNLIESIKNKNFIPHDTDFSGKIFNFCGEDSSKNLEKNMKSQPSCWYYKTNSVTYTVNDHKYRAIEFKDIDWANSIVVFGCSNVFGVGITDDDTITSQLSKLVNMPVINMGAPASSIDFSLYNSIILNEFYPTPKAIIHIWTGPHRATHFQTKKANCYGTWAIEENESWKNSWFHEDTHSRIHAMFASMISKQIWSTKTKYYEASFFKDTSEVMRCDFFEKIDYARDLSHPGIKTALLTAELIAKKL